MGRMKSAISEKKKAVQSKVQEMVDYRAASTQKTIKHVKSTERNGKRYKNTQSVFSINDDSDLSDEDAFTSNLVSSVVQNEKVSAQLTVTYRLCFSA
jgi:hypothetical protein